MQVCRGISMQHAGTRLLGRRLENGSRCRTHLFIYQAIESGLVPAEFLTAQFLQKLEIYEAFVVITEHRWCYSALLSLRKDHHSKLF